MKEAGCTEWSYGQMEILKSNGETGQMEAAAGTKWRYVSGG